MKPGWMIRKEAAVAAERERMLVRRRLVERMDDLCLDIDVWADQRPGETAALVDERLGKNPSLTVLQREYARLLRQASLRAHQVSTREQAKRGGVRS